MSLTFEVNSTSSQNESSNGLVYVFVPVQFYIKIIIASANVFAGVFGLTANSLILLFLNTRQRHDSRIMAFSRRSLSDTFIKSLALSNVLCCLTSLPIFTAEMFVDFIETDLQCKIVRFLVLFIPVSTITNYFVIGVEKYLSVFHPFNLPKRRMYRRAVIAAWVIGGACYYYSHASIQSDIF